MRLSFSAPSPTPTPSPSPTPTPSPAPDASSVPLSEVPAAPPSRAHQARVELLERISHFVLHHELGLTGSNLAVICSALSGANAQLAQAFVAREISGEPIDQRWLDTVIRLDPENGERMSELEKLMDQLEYSLMRFSQIARSAQDETSEHRRGIDAEITAIAGCGEGEVGLGDIERVIALSRTMLERVEQVEHAMQRSQAESTQLREALAMARMEADVDHLTRLPNRRAFERRLNTAAMQVQAGSARACVGFVDVDHFKAINDTHGHDAGDRVLVSVATTLAETIDSACFVARHGGEEFAILFNGMDAETAFAAIDGVRRAQAVKRNVNRETGRPFGKITFSGGITELHGIEDTRAALARADEALYEAKNSGRNCIAMR